MQSFSHAICLGLKGSAVAAIAFVYAPLGAFAHGAHIQARTASAVEIQASYDTGEPMAAAQVHVYAPENPQIPLLTGVTDESGRFVFVPDQPGNWEISVRQAGHGDLTVVPVAEGGGLTEGFTNDIGLTPLQRVIIAGAVTWGCVGTALYFWRGKR